MIEEPQIPAVDVEPSAHVTAQIRAQVAANLVPARGLSPVSRWLWGLTAVAGTLGCVGFAMGQPIAEAAPARSLLASIVGLTLVAGATFLGLARAGTAIVSLRARAALAFAPVVALALLALVSAFWVPVDLEARGGSLLGCVGNGVLIALVPLVALLVLWRRTDPFAPRLTGALIGGWAGLAGATGLALACPSNDVAHILFSHGVALVGGAALGAWLGRPLLAP